MVNQKEIKNVYELYKISEDLYQIHHNAPGSAMEGSLLAIGTYLVHTLKFDPDQLEVALLDMLDKGCDSANFGYNRTFIYSFERSKKYGKKTA